MKKRTKISLRTKTYLTIVGLLALTGALYAANPAFFTSFPQSTGVAISPNDMYATSWCSQDLSHIDCMGVATVVGQIPAGTNPCIEKYLEFAPTQSANAGFNPTDLFITEGFNIYKFSGGVITPFAQVGCPFSDHSSITFDKVGTFGNKMIITCENGPIFTVDNLPGGPHVDFIASTTNAQHTTHPEGPAVAPSPGFGPLSGQILVADEDFDGPNNGAVHAIKNDGTVTYNVFNFGPPPGWLGAENVNVVPLNPGTFGCSGGSFFQAIEDAGAPGHQSIFVKYPSTDFTVPPLPPGRSVLVTSEAIPPVNTRGTALVTFNTMTNAYDVTLFDGLFAPYINEGARFVEADAVTPTPTPTATFTPTPTPTATFTPTATATFTPTATATATFTPTPTPTATATATPTPTPTPTVTPTTCGTAFAIGDLDAVVGNHVTFWSHSWWKDNHLSGGRAPASFKGFVNCTNPNPPACGGTWTSDPGNSGHPPDTVPADITVIVSSLITQSGPVESGDIPKMVTIHTDPGYDGNPGHAGTGTVTAVICGGAGPHQPSRPAPRPR